MVRFVDSGDESDVADDGLAPVTSLFGDRGAKAYAKTAADVRQELEARVPSHRGAASAPPSARTPPTPAAAQWRTEWDDEPDAGEGSRSEEAGWEPAVSTVPAARPIDLDAERAGRGRSRATRADRRDRAPTGDRAAIADRPDNREAASTEEAAERGLLKKLRARQLSVSEAKTYLGQHDLDGDAVAAIVDAFLARGYLDDARLAEQVVHAGVDRKGQGRQAIAQSLAKRGVPRDIADAALAELPDDDAERALEFARSKAASMRGLERDVALRRLAGQLARRGYDGSSALNAARQALDEAGRPSGRVRFE
ncbi:regulatory protein RecX [Microbacterium ureisolvens]|uniref:regulatory protein RecX n=1 Tax=Microbacterium ureisolvens TaxID=2781186 RepID=UPI00363F3750